MSGRNHGNRVHEAVLRGVHGIRRHMAAWSVADKVILCLSTAALCEVVVEWAMNPPHTMIGVVGAMLLCVALALLPWRGQAAAWMILVTALVGNLTICVDASGPGSTWGLLLAMVVLGRRARITECVASIGLVMASVTYATLARPEIMGYAVPSGIINFGIGLLCAYLVGMSILHRERQRTQREARHQLERARLQLLTSTSLHDSVSGNLSRILVTDERARRDHPEVYALCDMERIVGYAADALRETHRTVDMIHGDDPVEGTECFALLPAVRAVATSADRRLHGLGYDGESVVRGECDCRLDDRGYAFIALLREIYANIEHHCDPKRSAYHVLIRFTRNSVIMSQSNGLGTSDKWLAPPASGRGLTLHDEQIKGFGGTVRAGTSGGRWWVFGELPLHS